MDDQSSFETRAVLPSRRAWRAVVVPVLALVAIALAGLGGRGSDKPTANVAIATAAAAPSTAGERSMSEITRDEAWAVAPAQVVGLRVQALDGVYREGLGGDDEIAVAGWYVTTAITDCPPVVVIYRQASLPEIRRDADEWAYCQRSGFLYASRPHDTGRLPSNLDDNRSKKAERSAIAARLVVGVVVPRELEVIGGDSRHVVMVGRFVESGDECDAGADCRVLVIDHVAWTAGD